MNWKKCLTLAGGAAAAVAIAYLLVREDDNQAESKQENEEEKQDSKNTKKECKISKEELLQLLNEMQAMHTETKNMINSLIIAAKKCNYDFMAVYNEAKKKDTIDPLMKRQMVMRDFDNAIEKYHFDPDVSDAVTRLVKGQEFPPDSNMDKPLMSVDKIIGIHHYMLQELYNVEEEFQALPNKNDLDTKLIAISIQSIISAKVEEKFDVTSEEVEAGISAQQYMLSSNLDFAQLNIEMQSIMNKCVGESFSRFCDREVE